MHPEIFARLAPLPAKVKAVTVTDDNLVFNVFISEYLCERSRLAALNHELPHLRESFHRSGHPDRRSRAAG